MKKDNLPSKNNINITEPIEWRRFKKYEKNFGIYRKYLGKNIVSNIPRMTPDRNIYGISYAKNSLELKLDLKDVESQRDIGSNETVTSGFSMLNFSAVKTFTFGGKDMIEDLIKALKEVMKF